MRFAEREIKDFIAEAIFRLTLKKIADPEEELVKSSVLSSITIAELAVELEKKFGVSLSFMEVNAGNFCNLNQIARLVAQKL
jgi:acyl carrier protein